MTRKKPSQRRDWRMVLFLGISAVIVLTMLLSMFITPR